MKYLIHAHYTAGGIVQAIKGMYSLQDALQEAGVKVGRNKKALCLWHSDRSPSMHIYRDKVHCFACGRGGDAIDVYAASNGMETKDAVQALAARFGFQSGASPSVRRRWAVQQDQARKARQLAQDMEAAYYGLCSLLHGLRQAMADTLPEPAALDNEEARSQAGKIAAVITDVEAVLDGLGSEEEETKRQALYIALERGLIG